ncbi:mas-related G-protein coupled receptor member H-like [Heteronotia binoei]|uniref:mas-related G-protein coupled receptor member H-like n=1 Tax=Heteronotia binoei TaxID=13085 RepID=UPI00292CE491|nr:mas-related G-protein coupled receptor member H-like [Heteronotia binoei]XP_060112917.1 mas-related G-protein coupled receptor member H-like [Heteronotia binoei]
MEGSFHTLYRIKKNDTKLELLSINKSDILKEFRIIADICVPLCILGLIGNGIICWLLCCTIKRSRFMIYVLNLAIGDFVILLHYFVLYLLIILPSHASFYSQHIKVISLIFGSGTNLYFLTAVSAERYIMVSFPFWIKSHRPKYLTAVMCVSLWTLSFMLTMLEYFSCNPRYLPSHIIGFLYCHTAIVVQYIIGYLVFIPVMVFSTLALLIKIWKKTLKNFPTGLDISIVATVFLHLIFSAFTKMIVFINYFAAFMPSSEYLRVSLILDCADSTVYPFVYLLVGCWKKSLKPVHVLVEQVLNDKSDSNLRTQLAS